MKADEKDEIKKNGLFCDENKLFIKALGEVRPEVGLNNAMIQEEFFVVDMVGCKDIDFTSPIFITYRLEDVHPITISNQMLESISFKNTLDGEKKIFEYSDCSISKDSGEHNSWTFMSKTLVMQKPVSFIHEVQNLVFKSEEYKKRNAK